MQKKERKLVQEEEGSKEEMKDLNEVGSFF